jgi:hypothetical protein
MSAPAWHVQGQYYETCNCDFICPCVLGQMAVKPSKVTCIFAMAYQIERGRFGGLSLDGLGFIILGSTPGEMGKGQWSVGVVVDQRATAEQREAITGIASGAAGGPMAALSGLVGTFLGVESSPIEFTRDGGSWSVNASNLVRMSAQGAGGLNPAAPPLQLGNTGHPAADSFTLARAKSSHVAALGLSWQDTSGTNNGQYAPFSWQNA